MSRDKHEQSHVSCLLVTHIAVALPTCLLNQSASLGIMLNTNLDLDYTQYDSLDYEHVTFNLGTPELPIFGSPDGEIIEAPQPTTGGSPIVSFAAQAHSPASLRYTIKWKLQVRKGRMMTLTEDTVENIDISPGAYWETVLRTEHATVASDRVPDTHYKFEEIRVVVSTSRRGEDFKKRFDKLDGDWSTVEDKIRSGCSRGNNVSVTLSFIYKEIQPIATSKVGKTGRGATRKQLAARDELLAQQEAAGTRPVWKEVYELLECSSTLCSNRGFSCWRDPHTKKHHKLDSDLLEKLVDFAEDGGRLAHHDDVPEAIRDAIYKRDEEETMRKQRKRKASDPLPVAVRVCCTGRHDDDVDDAPNRDKGLHGERPFKLNFPVPMDQAPVLYADWLSQQVTNEAWRQGYRLACKVSLDQGYDVGQLYHRQDIEALTTVGVKRGIAMQFVQKVPEWLASIGSK